MTVHVNLADGLHVPLFSSHVAPLYRSHPWTALAATAVLLPLTAVVGMALFLASLSIYRMVTVNILGTDRYDNLRRPKHADRAFPYLGDLPLIRKMPPSDPHIMWAKELGTSVYVYRGLFYSPRVFLSDPKAMSYVLSASNSYAYPKPTPSRVMLQSLLGNGVLVAEGDVHKRQRKILQPAFGVSAIRDLTPFFFKYSEKLAQKIGEMVDLSSRPMGNGEKHGANGVDVAFLHQSEPSRQKSRAGAPVLDMSYWLSQATLDVIGDAGFGHVFNGLDKPYDPSAPPMGSMDVINQSFTDLMKTLADIGLARFIQLYISSYPGMQWFANLPTKRQRAIDATYAALEEVSTEIVEQKRREIQGEMKSEMLQRSRVSGDGKVTKADFDELDDATTTSREDGTTLSAGKDLLHLMMRANMANDVLPREKLSNGELIGQITTLLLAGNETTSTQTSWALHVLGDHKEVQARLRAEIHDHFGAKMDRGAISYDELMNMPYLDRFAKEMMRFKSPVPSTVRTCTRTDVVPLSKAYPDRQGRLTVTSVPVRKGQDIVIPIQAMNLSEDIWGPTAHLFDPDRWLDDRIPETAKKSGLPTHLMTFISGPRGCIGNRFAVAEFKALLCSLLGRFEFDNVEGWTVQKKQAITLRSRVEGQEELGSQMPLHVRRI